MHVAAQKGMQQKKKHVCRGEHVTEQDQCSIAHLQRFMDVQGVPSRESCLILGLSFFDILLALRVRWYRVR